jgi:hypothetical protein
MVDKVVQHHKRRGDMGLYGHVILRGKVEDSKSTLEDAKDPFNDIVSWHMMKVEEFLGCAQTWRDNQS